MSEDKKIDKSNYNLFLVSGHVVGKKNNEAVEGDGSLYMEIAPEECVFTAKNLLALHDAFGKQFQANHTDLFDTVDAVLITAISPLNVTVKEFMPNATSN